MFFQKTLSEILTGKAQSMDQMESWVGYVAPFELYNNGQLSHQDVGESVHTDYATCCGQNDNEFSLVQTARGCLADSLVFLQSAHFIAAHGHAHSSCKGLKLGPFETSSF